MPVKEIFGLIAALLSAASGIIYLYSIVRGKTKPHLFTHVLWSIITGILFAGQWVSGAGPGSWASLVTVITTMAVVPLCRRFGTRDIKLVDMVALIAGLLTIVPWILTHNPLWTVIFANIIDMWAILPTIRKTWNDPSSESLIAWLFTEGKHIFAIGALSSYSLNTYLYPVQAFSLNMILIGIILFRKKFVLRGNQ